MSRLLQRLALVAGRHPRRVFLVAALVLAAAGVATSRLSFDTDVLNLLPREDPVVQTFRETLEEFGSADLLLIVVRIPEGAPSDPYQELVDELGPRLEAVEGIEHVDYRLGEVRDLLAAFLPRSVLFLDDDGRAELAERLSDEGIADRVAQLRRQLSTPQSIALRPMLLLDPLGLSEILLERLQAPGTLSVDLASGYYLSQDHRLLLLLAEPTEPPQDIDFTEGLVARVDEAIAASLAAWGAAVDPEQPPPAPEVVLGGGYMTALDDASLIKRDIVFNATSSMVVVLLLFLWAFRRLGPLFFAFVPLSAGILLTFGFSGVAFGTLSSVTSGTAALLIGLAIDFVIVSYGRYVEERRSGARVAGALRRMMGTSGVAVVLGATTSAATFYAFTVTDFAGLEQMGILTGTGILLCMLAVLFLLPALLAWREERHRRQATRPNFYLHAFGTGRLIRWSFAYPRTVLALGALITVGLGFAATGLRWQDNIQEMRADDNRGIQVVEEVARHFGFGFESMSLVISGDSLPEVLELAHRASEEARRLVDRGVLAGVDSVTTVLPPLGRQQASLAWLREGREGGLTDPARVRTHLVAGLAAEGLRAEPFAEGIELLAQALAIEAPLDAEALATTEQGQRLLERYLRRGAEGWKTEVKLFPPPGEWKREAPPELETLAAELGPGVDLTGVNVLSRHLRQKIRGHAAIAAVLGLAMVVLLLWIDFRRLADVALSLAPLLVGIVWMLGAMVLLGLRMNQMNIFVITMIIGIGVDYGIHVVHRCREVRRAGDLPLEEGLRETGKAIALAALSTVVGFGSMALSGYPGLRSVGYVAILGALATALISVTLVPAWLGRRRA
jgi:uncharacterized protein